jgi:sugar/nucleoside kinase (ribokinase family)
MQSELTRLTSESLKAAAGKISGLTALVGPDAFVDEIIRVVDRRASSTSFTAMEKIADLGTRIVGAAGQSTNIELVVDRVKLGGNGPIMANALAAFGPAVTAVGPFGEGSIHAAFAEMTQRARVVSLGDPAHTDALEFGDGKLMLGKLDPLLNVTWERMLQRLGADDLKKLFTESSLVALVNWTMVPAMSEIWEKALDLLEGAGKGGVKGTRFFFDLADPEKHDDKAVADACHLLARFQEYGSTILGLNEKEAFRVGASLGYKGGTNTRDDVRAVAAMISDELPIDTVVVHPRAYAVVGASGKVTADVDGPFTENPLISTGAGDHFNAGFCLGKLLGLSDDQAATVAVGTSGYYVRHAASPTFEQLTQFLAEQA